MPRFVLIAFLILCLNYSKAQPYQPFAVEGAHWSMMETFCLGCDPTTPNNSPTFTNNCCFKINGDTTVNGLFYKKLWESSTVTTYENGAPAGFTSGNWQVIELIREDTALQKVYLRKISGTIYYPGPDHWCTEDTSIDSLLFDFSQTGGDSIRIHYRTETDICNYDSFGLDSIRTANLYGANRKVWYIHGGPSFYFGNFQLIEGVGYSFGLFGTPLVIGIDNYSYNTELLDYCVGPDSLCGTCYTRPVGIPDLSLTTDVSIFPNPSNTYVTMVAENIINSVVITDVSGRQILNQTFNASKVVIYTTGLAKGTYICKIYSAGQQTNKLLNIN